MPRGLKVWCALVLLALVLVSACWGLPESPYTLWRHLGSAVLSGLLALVVTTYLYLSLTVRALQREDADGEAYIGMGASAVVVGVAGGITAALTGLTGAAVSWVGVALLPLVLFLAGIIDADEKRVSGYVLTYMKALLFLGGDGVLGGVIAWLLL